MQYRVTELYSQSNVLISFTRFRQCTSSFDLTSNSPINSQQYSSTSKDSGRECLHRRSHYSRFEQEQFFIGKVFIPAQQALGISASVPSPQSLGTDLDNKLPGHDIPCSALPARDENVQVRHPYRSSINWENRLT